MNIKPCKHCGSLKHYNFQCFQNPKRSKYKLPRQGKVAFAMRKVREVWFMTYPANVYYCYLCGKRMTPAETTLDHVIPRSRAPHLRYELSNLKPCCWKCNGEKGSKVLD